MVGLYGGSFDPVHIGHLRIAEDIREAFNLSKVIFIPAYHSPLKSQSKASPTDRVNMLKLATKDNPNFEIDTLEIEREGKSYTVDTLSIYKGKLNTKPVFILGTDAFLSIHRWKDYKKLFSLANFVVVGRGEDTREKVESYVKEKLPFTNFYTKNDIERDGVYFFDSRRIDVSSTEIRKRIKENRSIKYLTHPEVEEYIYQKGLYKG